MSVVFKIVDTTDCRVDSLPASLPAPEPLMHVLGVLADPTRWRILTLLAHDALCTTHLQAVLGARQNLVSHHLKVLRDAGLVDTEPCGRFTYYRLRPGALDQVRQAVDTLTDASHTPAPKRPC